MRAFLWTSFGVVLCGAVAGGGCKKTDRAKPADRAPIGPAAVPAECEGAEAEGSLAWHRDRYDAAMTCARALGKPVVIDMWAPWCHTCLSMQATVLKDPALAPFADRFVFVSIDTDRPENAAAVGKYALQNWPTFFVVSPEDETVQARWLGAASVPQFRDMLKDGEAAYLAAKGGAALDPLMAGVRTGAQAANKKDWKGARAAWTQVIEAAPADWPRRSDVLVSLISATYKAEDYPACLQLALTRLGETGTTANAGDFVSWALECADQEGVDAAQAKAVREAAVAKLTAVVDDAAAPLSADDRSDAMMYLREAQDGLGKKDEAKAMAERQLAFLADTAGKAPDAWTRMTYNWPRAEVHVYLQRGLELVPALEQSAKDLPNEYDPPYRLAWVLMKSGDPGRALPFAKDAAQKAYGARRVRVQGLVVEIAKATGDRAEERAARVELVRVLESLPTEVALPEQLDKARKELAAMDEAAAGDGEADAGAGAGQSAPAPVVKANVDGKRRGAGLTSLVK